MELDVPLVRPEKEENGIRPHKAESDPHSRILILYSKILRSSLS
jgi:hypothetical protein